MFLMSSQLARRACRQAPGVVALFVAAWLAIGSAILGQSPAGPRVAVVTGNAEPWDIVVRPDGSTLLSWIQMPSPSLIPFDCFARGLGLEDVLDFNLSTLLRVPRTSRGPVGCPRMAGNASGNLVFVYGLGRPYAIRIGDTYIGSGIAYRMDNGIDQFPSLSEKLGAKKERFFYDLGCVPTDLPCKKPLNWFQR